MSFENIRQALLGMNYQWNSPETYIVFVPGLSFVAKKIQMANLLPITTLQERWENLRQVDAESRQVRTVLRWHFLGGLAQSVACCIAMKVCALPIWPVIALLAVCDVWHTWYTQAKTTVTIVDGWFYPNSHPVYPGFPKTMTVSGAF